MFGQTVEPFKAYLIHTTGISFKLCKILNEYDTKEETKQALLSLLAKETTEKTLLKEFSKKDVLGIGNDDSK